MGKAAGDIDLKRFFVLKCGYLRQPEAGALIDAYDPGRAYEPWANMTRPRLMRELEDAFGLRDWPRFTVAMKTLCEKLSAAELEIDLLALQLLTELYATLAEVDKSDPIALARLAWDTFDFVRARIEGDAE